MHQAQVRLADVGPYPQRVGERQGEHRRAGRGHGPGLEDAGTDHARGRGEQAGVLEPLRGQVAGRRQGGEACLGRGDVLLPRTFHDQRDLLLGSLEVGLQGFDPGTGRVHFLHGDAVHGTQLLFARQLGGSVRQAGPGRGRGRPGPRHLLGPAALAQPGEHLGLGRHLAVQPLQFELVAGRVEFGHHLAGRDPRTLVHGQGADAARVLEGELHLADIDVAVQGERSGTITAAAVVRTGGENKRGRDQGRQGGAHSGATHGQDSRGSGRKRPRLPGGPRRGVHSPMIFTSTRFLRRPSNSP